MRRGAGRSWRGGNLAKTTASTKETTAAAAHSAYPMHPTAASGIHITVAIMEADIMVAAIMVAATVAAYTMIDRMVMAV